MYEEYQQNPNPGFDRRSRYEDAGGYLRSILGSFLNQKKDSEEKAVEQERFDAQMKQNAKLAEDRIKADDKGLQWASTRATLKATEAPPEGTPDPEAWYTNRTQEVLNPRAPQTEYDKYTERDLYFNKMVTAGVEKEENRVAFVTSTGKYAKGFDVAKIQAQAKTDAADTRTGGDVKVAEIRNQGAVDLKATPPAVAPGSEKPTNVNKFADGVEIDAADAVVKNVIEQLKLAKKIGEVPSYDTLRSSLKALTTEAKTRGLTKKQKDALQTIVQAGVSLTPAQAAEAARDIVDFTEAPTEPTGGAGPTSIEPRVITMGGTRYLEDGDGQLYEMIMG